MAKLVLVVFLGGLVVFLGSLVLTLQLILVEKRTLLASKGNHHHGKKKKENDFHSKNLIETLVPTEQTKDLKLWKTQRRDAQAYWNQVVPYLKQWDALLQDHDEGGSGTFHALPPPTSHIYTSLQQAARLGHSEAQYYMANAMASAILPFNLPHNLTVPVDMIPLQNDPAAVQSYLYWHMAAVDGHIPSAVTLGYRNFESCETSLAYYQEAAHAIIDALETSATSRAKVLPPMDQHDLGEIYRKGSTASQLHVTNQPDEPQDAIRYYHMRASSSNDLEASFVLARLYHYGKRGVTLNLTTALLYYEMGAKLGHWEAAGQAGTFHLFGLGMDYSERNLVKASRYLKMGAPMDVETCRKRFRNMQLQKHKRVQGEQGEENVDDQCDNIALNGLGLLQLWGMPTLLDRDVELAQKYFELSRDMGNVDARYNLAMMRLGWKTHYKTLDHLGEDHQSTKSNFLLQTMGGVHTQKPGPTKADYLVALQELVAAANNGHLQAKHRLAILYANGIKGSDGSVIIERNCNKALALFAWVTRHANPHLSHATRKGYKLYTAGNWEAALRNYLVAAEMGHEVSQINAAFLLEQGVCLSLDKQQCAAASLRLWTAAVQTNPEAALQVGDMYYYGRLRESEQRGWLSILLYPERHFLPLAQHFWKRLHNSWWERSSTETVVVGPRDSKESTCDDDAAEDGTCHAAPSPASSEKITEKDILEQDLEMAAKYYRLAAELHKSARANFNLGFLYEWGLGVKQDFPLAKRHYDLAGTSGEAELAVQIALTAMNLHERLVKLHVAYQEWRSSDSTTTETMESNTSTGDDDDDDGVQIPMAAVDNVGHPVPDMSQDAPRTRTDVIISHLLSWETFLIVILTIVLSKLLQRRRTP
jgi:SEL1 protein